MELENGFSPLPDFLKIYNSQEMSQHLVLFNDYRQYYPTPLPETAVLKKPEGMFWIVKWKICQEIIRFEDGWTKFVKENAIIDGDYLLFTYDGARSFWVRIYRNGLILKSKEAPNKVQEISDDDDDDEDENDDGDQEDVKEEEDTREDMVTSLSLGSGDKDEEEEDDKDDADYDDDGNDDDDDDDDATLCEFDEAPESSKRGVTGRKSSAASLSVLQRYLKNIDNPYFVTNAASNRLPVSRKVINRYSLKFGRSLKLEDKFGIVKGTVNQWSRQGSSSSCVMVKKWDKIYKRNKAQRGDTIICEIARRRKDVVRSIKVHFVKK